MGGLARRDVVDDACIQPTTDVLFTPIAQAPLNVSFKNKWRKLDFIIAWPRRDGAARDGSIVGLGGARGASMGAFNNSTTP